MAKISIIIPVYNVDKYLRACLDSIINQTFTDFEVICVNDGSEDSSLGILNEYAAKDKRFIVLSQKNQGSGVARNNGINLAGGKYIQFIDPDDWIETDMLETLFNYAEKHNSQIIKFNYKEYNDYSGQVSDKNFCNYIKKELGYDLNKKSYYTRKDFRKGFLIKSDLHCWANFFLTDFIKSNDIKFSPHRIAEDHLFTIGATLLANRIDYLDDYLYFYRIREGSAINVKSNNNFCVFNNIRLLKDFIIKHDLYDELKDEIDDYAKEIISWHYGAVPGENTYKYEKLCRKYFYPKEEFEKFLKRKRVKRKFIENIFSIKNETKDAIKYKVITVLGMSFYIKPVPKSPKVTCVSVKV